MNVLVGPTYSMEASVASPSCVRDRSGVAAAAQEKSTCLFLESNGGEKEDRDETGGDKFCSGYRSDDSSDSSSSIGDPGDSEEEEENDDVASSSELKKSTLSLDSLEDSLPIKRGLSNHFSGRSKSFANLSDVSTVKDLAKEENPFNKRRRLLIVNKLSRSNRRSSFYSWQNPISMPLLPALEEEEDDDCPHQLQNLSSFKQQATDGEEEGDQQQLIKNPPSKPLNGSRFKIGLKSQSCFSLADLQEDQEEDENQ